MQRRALRLSTPSTVFLRTQWERYYMNATLRQRDAAATAATVIGPSSFSSGRGKRFFSIQTTGKYVNGTKKWYESVVLAAKLCPFAPSQKRGDWSKLRIVASNATTRRQAISDVQSEIAYLFQNENGSGNSFPQEHHETTLIVMAAGKSQEKAAATTNMSQVEPWNISDFRDFVRFSWDLQECAIVEGGYEGKLQLVLFHPQATHQTYSMEEESAAAQDYTIRSPYPVIHLLREEDVMKAVTSGYPDLEGLPARNKAKLRKQGIETCQLRLQECYETQ